MKTLEEFMAECEREVKSGASPWHTARLISLCRELNSQRDNYARGMAETLRAGVFAEKRKLKNKLFNIIGENDKDEDLLKIINGGE
jgi:hypothetical protein